MAISKGVNGLYDGSLTIIEKPDKQKYLNLSGVEGKTTRKKADEFDFFVAVAEYRIDLDEYKDNAKLVREALALLARWVDLSIRNTVITYTSLKDT